MQKSENRFHCWERQDDSASPNKTRLSDTESMSRLPFRALEYVEREVPDFTSSIN